MDSYPYCLIRRTVVSSGSARIQLCVERCIIPPWRPAQGLCLSVALPSFWFDQIASNSGAGQG
jgi:hypothetical protein